MTTQARQELTRTQRTLAGLVAGGTVTVAAVGFAGSYTAVHELALHKGFGAFATVFPIGIDAGIVVLLALDLLLRWLRIPFPLLRQTAWLLTAATIAFNAAAAWPDPLGVGMHGIIPVLFVVSVEAARHAVGHTADVTAQRHMEPVRAARWLLAPVPTFRLWRRMKLWELRSYDEALGLERQRLTYRARLRARHGRAWRLRAPVEALLPLRLTRFGVPLPGAATASPVEAPGAAEAPTTVAVPASHEALPAAPVQRLTICQAALAIPQAPHRPTTLVRHRICCGPTGTLPVQRIICGGPHRLIPAPHMPPRPRREAPPKPAPRRQTPPPQRPTPPRQPAPTLVLAGLSKAAAICAAREALPDTTAPRIAEYLAQHGITVTAKQVRSELSRARKRLTPPQPEAPPGTGHYL